MTGKLILINRGLYAVLALTGALATGLPWLDGDASTQGAVPPMPVPGAIEMPLSRDLHLRYAKRNPFDPTGVEWKPRTAPKVTKPEPKRTSKVGIRGIIQLGEKGGVFTDHGFVRHGENLGHGRLAEIHQGEIVISGEKGRQEIRVNTDRLDRIKRLKGGGSS